MLMVCFKEDVTMSIEIEGLDDVLNRIEKLGDTSNIEAALS